MILMLKVFLNDNNDDNSDDDNDVEKKGKLTFKDRVSNQPSSMLQKKMNQHKFLRFIFSVKLPISSLQESAFPPHFPHRSNFFLEYIKWSQPTGLE